MEPAASGRGENGETDGTGEVGFEDSEMAELVKGIRKLELVLRSPLVVPLDSVAAVVDVVEFDSGRPDENEAVQWQNEGMSHEAAGMRQWTWVPVWHLLHQHRLLLRIHFLLEHEKEEYQLKSPKWEFPHNSSQTLTYPHLHPHLGPCPSSPCRWREPYP
jgi:hypothetical protein